MPAPYHWLAFNLSYSNRLALVAVGERLHVGVDVERVRFDLQTADLERYCLTRSEIDALPADLPARRRAFFQCWTRKESYLKATGEGLACDLTSVAIERRSSATDVLRVVTAWRDRDWYVRDLQVVPGYKAAITLDDSRPVVLRTWPGRWWCVGGGAGASVCAPDPIGTRYLS